MTNKTTIKIFWAIGILLSLNLLVAAFVQRPQSTKDYIEQYKMSLNSQSASALYTEPKQEAKHTNNTKLKGVIEAILVGTEKIEVLGCFDLPDAGSWDPDSVLTVKGEEIEWVEFKLLNAKNPETYTSNHRCYLLTFPYGYTGQEKLKVKVSVRLTQEVNRGLINEETGKKIKEKLQEEYPDLDFNIVATSGDQGGGAYVVFKSKPAGMSNNEIFALINEAMIDSYPGSWDFEVTVP
jgi:hypothetical protein